MSRTFQYTFEPMIDDPVGAPVVSLEVADIEAAGVREVLQTPGAAMGSWAMLEALLDPTGHGSAFHFREPLGQAREVKVALSGLFGRFVARAYLEQYFHLSFFAHLGRRSVMLGNRRQVEVRRLATGDLPDWIACAADLSRVTVAEAKGCHDKFGPGAALGRAWTQVQRVGLFARNNRRVTHKQVAVATRWGSGGGGAPVARMAVRDPLVEGDDVPAEAVTAMYIGLMRLHMADLLAPLGHPHLAQALRVLSGTEATLSQVEATAIARQLADAGPYRSVDGTDFEIDELLGGFVTRAGPLRNADVSAGDQDTLARLELRPFFVGIERGLLRAVAEGNPDDIRASAETTSRFDTVARGGRDGSWVVPVGSEGRTVREK